MLKIGQRVRIEDTPLIGYEYFDCGNINTYDWIVGIRKLADGIYYQLVNEDYDLLWDESELRGMDEFLHDNQPAFGIGDELFRDNGTLTTDIVTGIMRFGDTFEYGIGDEGGYIPENQLKLYRKYGRDAEYSLF